MRPKTLAKVAELTAGGDSFDRCLANFLDEFYATPVADALSNEPPLLAANFGDPGRVQDAYLAATAEELARRFNFPCPAWTSAEQRAWLLETAVQLVAAPDRPVPLRQYAALLDLSFSLGFQTDALAKLREQYSFDYVDHAKDGRPRDADRGGGAMPLFVRGSTDAAALLRTLGLERDANRQAIISAYRRLAAQHHPDKVHGEPESVQSNAAARFIEITRAYEALMTIYRD